jgi:hypothetical protein
MLFRALYHVTKRTPTMQLSPRKSRRYARFFEVADEPQRGFSSIAPVHYRSALKLLQQAENVCAGQQWKTCYYVLSAICLFHASLECYLNEELALSLELLRDEPAEDLFKRCDTLQNGTFTRGKLDKFLDLYGIRERMETAIIENVACLCDLRDRLYHYSPTMRPINEYPEAAVVVLRKVGVDSLNTDWTNLVGDLRVGAWAKDATERFLNMHHAVKGWPSPFSGRPSGWNVDYGSPP